MGKREQAREDLTTAADLYREMDMRFWLAKAEAAMGGLGVKIGRRIRSRVGE